MGKKLAAVAINFIFCFNRFCLPPSLLTEMNRPINYVKAKWLNVLSACVLVTRHCSEAFNAMNLTSNES